MIYSWLIVIILAYLFFAFSSFGDKLVLAGRPKPKSYIFYVGAFGLFVVLFIPFIKFGLPTGAGLTWIILDALVRIAGLYAMYEALERFDVSKVMVTIGATQPIFIFALTWLFGKGAIMPASDILAFLILFLACIIVSVEKTPKITGDYLKITLFSSIMFSLDYVFTKMVFLNQPFLQGVIWTGIFIFIFVSILLFSKSSRKEIFAKSMVLDKGVQAKFILAQACGGAANFLQSFAIFLVPVVFLPIVNSLRGIQYAFLFIITLFISIFFPKVLKEGLSKRIILQKVISIILIVIGLAILVIY